MSVEFKSVEFEVEPVYCSVEPIHYDADKCIACGRCAAVKGEHPIVMYPGECYYCGACVMVCPKPGAIKLVHPLMNEAKFVPTRGGDQAEQ